VPSDCATRLDLPDRTIIPPKEDKQSIPLETNARDLLCYVNMENFNTFPATIGSDRGYRVSVPRNNCLPL